MGKFNLADFFGNTLAEIIDSIGAAIDRNVTNKKEKLAAQKEITEVLLAYQTSLDDELTERLKIEMQSDNKLTKLIRPLSLIFTTVVVSALAITDGNFGGSFVVDDMYIELFKSLMGVQYMFYFGSRGVEKIMEKIYISNTKK